MIFLEVICWVALGIIVYTLFVYPLLTLLLAAVVRKRVDKKPITPNVSFIIAAYNEEDAIAQKIEDTLKLDYPADKLEVIVASDGSTDRTDEIVRSFADRGVKLCRVEGRKGKTNALNETVEIATGEILIFSDATGIYNKEAIREITANFNDPAVGCVTGRVTYNYGKDSTSTGFKAYQRVAAAIRRAETLFGSQTTVSGSIHAIKRKLFISANQAYSYDVIDAIHAVMQGYRTVYESNAISKEDSRVALRDEFNCRVRMSIRAKPMIPYIINQLIRTKKFGYLFQMTSHKLLRWFLWLPLLLLLVTNVLLISNSRVYFFFAVVQILFYSIGETVYLYYMLRIRISFLSPITFFILANIASFVGTIKYLAGEKMNAWEPVR